MRTEVLGATIGVPKAISLLKDSECVALPTETVYGLAANAFDPNAVSKIYLAKERPSFDPLIVHISRNDLSIPKLIESGILSPLPDSLVQWLHDFVFPRWPGPLTIVLPKGDKIPDLVTSGQDSVGIRCPKHSLFQEVLSKIDFPLAAPSANRFGRISPTNAQAVQQELDGKIPLVLDGGSSEIGVESTILRPVLKTEGKTLNWVELDYIRPGAVGYAEVTHHSPVPVQWIRKDHLSRIQPGLLASHYAPEKKLFLISEKSNFLNGYNPNLPTGLLFWDQQSQQQMKLHLPNELQPKAIVKTTYLNDSNTLDSSKAAGLLFQTLRELDHSPSQQILAVVNPPEQDALTHAILDRLEKAAFKG